MKIEEINELWLTVAHARQNGMTGYAAFAEAIERKVKDEQRGKPAIYGLIAWMSCVGQSRLS